MGRVLAKAPLEVRSWLVAATVHPTAWLHQIVEGLAWLAAQLPPEDSRRAWTQAQWFSFFKQQPKLASKHVSKVVTASWSSKPCGWSEVKSVVALAQPIVCPQCVRLFQSHQGLAVHMHKMHGYKREARQWVDRSHCPVCLFQYWTRERVLGHLATSLKCAEQLRIRGNVIDETTAEALLPRSASCFTDNAPRREAGL